MGYRIVYGSAMKKRPLTIRKRWMVSITKLTALVGVICAVMAFPKGRAWVRDIAVPGNNKITEKAVGQLVQDLKDGQKFGKAIEVFCQEILSHG